MALSEATIEEPGGMSYNNGNLPLGSKSIRIMVVWLSMLKGVTANNRRGATALSWLTAAIAGFSIAVVLGLAVFRFAGFDIVCKRQYLCTVSDARGWASQVHLTWEADPSRSFTVSWRTDSTKNQAIVNYRPAGAEDWQQAAGTSRAMPPNGLLKTRGAIHRTTVEGLDPGIAYEYRVSNDNKTPQKMSAVFQTRTAPAGEAPFSLIFIGDIGMAGRPDGLSSGVAALQDFLMKSDVNFLIGGGDYAYGNGDGRYVFPRDAIDEWFRQWQPVFSRLPFMPAYGTHDLLLREGFRHWGPRIGQADGYGGGRAYSFDVGKAHFTSMLVPEDGHLPPADLLEWLDNDLASARQNGAEWLIVYQHASVFGHGPLHPADQRLRPLLMPILEKHNVDLHFSAHDQSYERTYPLRTDASGIAIGSCESTSYAAGAGVSYLKVSPAGKTSDINGAFSELTAAAAPQIVRRSDDGFHFAQVDLSAGKLDVTVYKRRPEETEPTVFDSFSIQRNDRGQPSNAPAQPNGIRRTNC